MKNCEACGKLMIEDNKCCGDCRDVLLEKLKMRRRLNGIARSLVPARLEKKRNRKMLYMLY